VGDPRISVKQAQRDKQSWSRLPLHCLSNFQPCPFAPLAVFIS